MSGANTYTGATTINAGVLSADTLANGGVASSIGASTNAAANLVLGGGTLQYTGGTVATNRNYTLTAGTTSSIDVTGAATNLTISGASTATTGGLTKLGSGKLTLSGANLYTGLTTVSAGTLAEGANNALSSGGLTVSGGTFDIGTFTDTVGAVTLASGNITGTTGVLTGTSYAVQSGAISAILGGAGALTKTTAGTVTLSRANTYTGLTTVSAGTLAVTANNALGTSAAGTSVAAGATLDLQNVAYGTAEAVTLNGGTLATSTGTSSLAGGVTLTAPSSINVGGTQLTLSGAVSAPAALAVAGGGSLTAVNAGNDFSNVSIAGASNVSLRDTNAIAFGASSLAGNLAVVAGGNITQTAAVSVGGVASLTTNVAGADVLFNNASNNFAGSVAVSTTGAGSDADIRATGNLVFGASPVGASFTGVATGNLILNGNISAGASGDAIVLVAGSRFNNAGNVSLTTPAGRWLVWSANPNPFNPATGDIRGSLAYAFKQYNATYGVTTPAQSTGNGFLYTFAPSITPGLTGTVSKVYNGTATASLTSGNFTATGAVDGDLVTLSGSGSYDNKNVGTAKTVTATGIAATAVNGAAAVYGYTVSPNTANANIGVITAAPLTVTAQADSRVYNGTTSSAVAPAVTGSTYDPVGTAATQSYDNKNVGTGKTLTASGLVMNDGNGGNNYAITYVNNVTGVITPAALALNAVSDSKVYDGTTASGGIVGTVGLQGSDSVGSLSQSYASKNVLGSNGSTLAVNTGYVVNDGNGGANYTVTTNTALGTITPASLTGSITASDKVYDSMTAAAIASRSLAGVIGSDVVSYTGGTATFADKNVGAGKTVTATGLALSGTDAGNYTVNTTAVTTANITPASLTGSITASDKVYDSNTAAAIASRSLSGVIGSDVVSYTGGTATFADKNAGAGKTVTATGLGLAGTDAGNYTVNATAFTTASITSAALVLNAVSGSKVYDGTTSSSGVVGTVGLQGADSIGSLSQSYASKNVLGYNGSTLAVNAGYVVNDGNGGANYIVTTNAARGTITPASLIITADDKSRLFGTPNPPFTATYAGLVAGETAAALGGTLSFLIAATTTSAPGGYPITPYGQTSGNYAIAYVDGTLTVQGASVGPGRNGGAAADQQAIGAQYTSQGMPDVVLTRIRYVLDEDKCQEGAGTSGLPCAGDQRMGNVVRMVNGGILLPQQ